MSELSYQNRIDFIKFNVRELVSVNFFLQYIGYRGNVKIKKLKLNKNEIVRWKLYSEKIKKIKYWKE